jgi:hypothetical protein
MNDTYEARRLREQLDEEMAGLSARPEALERILSAARNTAGREATTTVADGRRRGSGSRIRVPHWLLAAAAVAAVAVAVPVVRSLTQDRPPQPSGTQPGPPTSPSAPTRSSAPSPDGSLPATGPSSSGGTTTSSASAGVPGCDGPTLQVLVGTPSGAAGTVYYTLTFRNSGDRPCYLRGFPGAAAADAAGAVRVDAERDRSTPSTQVVLAKGAVAHAVLAVRNVPVGSEICPAYPKLLVTPPDSRRTTTMTVPVRVCADTMRISVVQPGAGP